MQNRDLLLRRAFALVIRSLFVLVVLAAFAFPPYAQTTRIAWQPNTVDGALLVGQPDMTTGSLASIANPPVASRTPRRQDGLTPSPAAASTAKPSSTPAATRTPTGKATAAQTSTRTLTAPRPASSPTATRPLPTRTATRTRMPTAKPVPTSTKVPTLGPSNVVIQSSAAGTTFVPDADAYVDSANPGANYGTSAELRVNGAPVAISFLRFDAKRLTGNVQNAKLRVYANSSASDSISAYLVSDNTWRETGITFNSVPAIGNLIGSAGPVAAGTWLTFDITAVIDGKGTYSFALTTTGGTPVSVASRESGANAPQLVIETGTPTPTPTVTATATPTATATNTLTPTPTNTPIPTGAISAVVFNDLNGDGSYTADEPRLAGAAITVKDSSGNVVGLCTTDGTAPCDFNGLPSGSYYTVTEANPPGYFSTTPDILTALVPNGKGVEVRFGDRLFPPTPTPTATATNTPTPTPTMTPVPGAICVTVFEDLNANGLWDTPEALLAPQNVTIMNSSEVTVGTWDGTGAQPHCFQNLTPGDYTAVETNPPGYGSSTADSVFVSVASSQSTSVLFGDMLCLAPTPVMGTPIYQSSTNSWLLFWQNVYADYYQLYGSMTSTDPSQTAEWHLVATITGLNYNVVQGIDGTYFYVTATNNCGMSGPSNVVALP